MPDLSRLLTVDEAAVRLGISVHTVYKMVSEGRIPHTKIGRLVRFDPVVLDQWIKQQTVMPMPINQRR